MVRAAISGSVAQIRSAFEMARSARLVATGLRRMNSRLENTTQQKYCDHGLSTAVLTTTWPIFFARISCGSGGKPR